MVKALFAGDAGIPVFASPDGGPAYVGDVPGRLRSEPSAAPGAGGRADGGAQVASGDQGEEVRRLRERVARLEGLDSSAGSLPPDAQGAVNKARTAAQNGDLAMARYWLSVAQAEEQKRH